MCRTISLQYVTREASKLAYAQWRDQGKSPTTAPAHLTQACSDDGDAWPGCVDGLQDISAFELLLNDTPAGMATSASERLMCFNSSQLLCCMNMTLEAV